MPDRSRISPSPPIFDSYIRNSDTFLQETDPNPPHTPNWQRLGLTQQYADYWHEQRQYWQNILYPQYTSTAKRTKSVTVEVNMFIAAFRAFGSPLLNIMAASPNATNEDAQTFNFKLHRNKPTRVVEPIAEDCHVLLQPIGGGRMKFQCRTSSHSKRPALAARADSVMFAFKIGNTQPLHFEDGTTMVVRRQAKFVYDFGGASAGSLIHIYVCWNDSKRPTLKGPWSILRSIHLF